MLYNIAGLCFTDQSGLAFKHDPRMVALSFLIALLGSFGALEMAERARAARRAKAKFWHIGASVVLGAGIWAMHFLGILAIRTPRPIDVAPFPTFVSLAVVVAATAVGVQVCFVDRPNWKHFAIGGTLIGAGIIVMHYIGMAALELAGPLAYHPGGWLLSAVIAVAAATTALVVAQKFRQKWKRVIGAIVLAVGICSMHYTAMHSAVGLFLPGPKTPSTFSRELLAAAVAGTTGALLLIALVLAAAARREAELNAALRRAEAATRAALQAESRLAAAIEAIPEGFVLLDAEDRIVLCNTHYREVYGLSSDAVMRGMPFETLIRYMTLNGYYVLDGSDAESWIANRMARHHNGDGGRYYQNLTDGRWVQVQDNHTSDGDIVGIRVDVTEARHREAAERDRQKLAALGQLAGGVAHEINNLLQPILTLPDAVIDRLPPGDADSFQDLACVEEAGGKIRDIVRNILLYARKEEPQLTELDMAAELRATLRFVRDIIPRTVDLRADELAAQSGCYAAANKTQLTQVVTNLVVNAAQAMNGVGTVTVSLSVVRATADQAIELGIEAGHDYLAISVGDTGAGMDAPTRARIFEPFFTTKPPGQGTGLGLSVADGILRSWHGAITVHSTIGVGTTFVLYVPLIRTADKHAPEKALPAPMQEAAD